MPIDFFIAKCQIENIRDKEFGICDDEDENEKTPAYVDTAQPKKWVAIVKHAVDEQLQTTIDNFKANHDISKYRYKRAFACNKKYPNFRVSYKGKMDAFYKKNHIRLKDAFHTSAYSSNTRLILCPIFT